jgi:hypothetical protein
MINLNATNDYFTIVFDGIWTRYLEVTRLDFYHWTSTSNILKIIFNC